MCRKCVPGAPVRSGAHAVDPRTARLLTDLLAGFSTSSVAADAGKPRSVIEMEPATSGGSVLGAAKSARPIELSSAELELFLNRKR